MILLQDFATLLTSAEALQRDVETLQWSVKQLKDLFLLVVVGEFNSGKSSFINSLLGEKFLQDGVTPTTSKIDLLRYGTSYSVTDVPKAEGEERRIITVPVDWLKQISLVDTPGTNAVFRIHQQLTEEFLPRADLVLWVTSTDRAFSESERLFLEQAKSYEKKVVVILSKIDIIDDSSELDQIIDFIKKQFSKLTNGNEPIIFPVSSKKALKARRESSTGGLSGTAAASVLNSNPKWQESRFGALEDYIYKTLSSEERAWLKFQNPMGIANHLVTKYLTETQLRLEVLSDDTAVLKRINDELVDYKKDMLRDYGFHLNLIDNILIKLEERGNDFLQEKIAITNIAALANSESVKREWETQVIGRSTEDIEAAVGELVDWLLKKNAKQWNNIMEYIDTRTKLNQYHLIGKIQTQFDYNRSGILKDLKGSAQAELATFDHKEEASRLSLSIRAGVYQTAVMEMGAVGSGFLIPSLFDISGIIPFSTIAIMGLGVLPFWRQKLKANLHGQIDGLRKRLKDTLEVHFKKQMEDGITDIHQNISPYTHFIGSQSEFVQKMNDELKRFKIELERLSRDIELAFSRK